MGISKEDLDFLDREDLEMVWLMIQSEKQDREDHEFIEEIFKDN